MNYAIELEIINYNPASKIKKLKTGPGWLPWVLPAIERAHGVLEGPTRTAFMLALYTGQRRGDVLAMRWDAIEGDAINVKQQKTGKALWIPLHPTLIQELTQLEKKGMTIVCRRDGGPYTDSGFNRIWQTQQANHGFKGLQFHGLRRNAVNALLEAGCSVPQVAAITGQSFEMVQHYAQEVDQKLQATSAMNKWKTSSVKPSVKPGHLKEIKGGKL